MNYFEKVETDGLPLSKDEGGPDESISLGLDLRFSHARHFPTPKDGPSGGMARHWIPRGVCVPVGVCWGKQRKEGRD